MGLTLTTNISTNKDLRGYRPVFVVEVYSGSTYYGIWTNYTTQIDDWAGAGNHATGHLLSISDIITSIDWRGGLANMQPIEVAVADSGTLITGAKSIRSYDLAVWFCFKSGTLAKSDAVLVYKGAIDNVRPERGRIVITTADLRERRYANTVLSTVGIDNEDNQCGGCYEQSSYGTWGTTRKYREQFIPEQSRGEKIPICFNKPSKVRGVLVTDWPGTDNSTLTSANKDLRGPVWVFSDMRLTYGDGNGQYNPTAAIYHYDQIKRIFAPLTEHPTVDLNDANYGYNHEIGEQIAFCARSVSQNDNALYDNRSISFLFRMPFPVADAIDAAWDGDSDALVDGNYAQTYNWARLANPGSIPASNEDFPVDVGWGRNIDLPLVGVIRAAFYELKAAITSGSLPSGVYLEARHSRRDPWGGSAEDCDYFHVLSSSVTAFNNIMSDAAATDEIYDAEVEENGYPPFLVGNDIGPAGMTGLVNQRVRFILRNTTVSSVNPTVTITLKPIGSVFACDVPLRDVLCAADVYSSFDLYVLGNAVSGTACLAYETIAATLYAICDVAFDDIKELLEAGDSDTWDDEIRSGTPHDSNRLDFQLREDMSGRDLVDVMCYESGIWLIHDQDGKEAPLYFDRLMGSASGAESRQSADFDADTIKDGSLRCDWTDYDDIYTRFRVRYFEDYFAGGFAKELWVDENGGNLSATADNTLLSGWCSASQTANGMQRELLYEARTIQDDDTAEALLKMLAARHVDRAVRCSFTTTLAAIGLRPGDFPVVEHDTLMKFRSPHYQQSGATVDYLLFSGWFVELSGTPSLEGTVQPGDWVKVTGGGLEADSADGWHRVFSVVGSSAFIRSNNTNTGTNYTGVTVTFMPAMMVESVALRPGGAEIDVSLVEIPKDPFQ